MRRLAPARMSVRPIEWALVAVAMLMTLFWWANPDAFIADDSYFYLEIAQSISRDGKVSFTGVYPTNGFHPLWLALLSAYTWLIHTLQPEWLGSVRYALPLSSVVLLGGTLLLIRFARRLRLSPIVVVLPVVCFLASFGVLYSEAHMTFVCLAALLLVLSREYGLPELRAVVTALACAALFFARLDMIFVVIAVYIWYLVRSRHWMYPVVSGGIFAILVAPYLVVNVVVFGGLTPISGFLKSTFPAVNLEGLSYGGGLVVKVLRINVLFGVTPLLLAGLAYYVFVRSTIWTRTARGLLWAVAAGVGLQLFYTGLFTWGHTNWYWYYVPAVVVGAWAAGWLERAWDGGAGARAMGAIVLVGCFIAFSTTRLDDGWPSLTAQAIHFIRTSGVPDSVSVFVSERPGRTAFYTDVGIVAADMLTSNRRFYTDMVNSENALMFLRSYCRRNGRPLRYAVYSGGLFVTVDKSVLRYFDPRMTTIRRREIGRMQLGANVFRSPEGTVAWRLSAGS